MEDRGGSSKVRNMSCARDDECFWETTQKENAACALEPRARKICACDACEVRCTVYIITTSHLRRSSSILASSSSSRHGNAPIISRLLRSHLFLAVCVRTVLVSQTLFWFHTRTSPVVALMQHARQLPKRFLFCFRCALETEAS